MLSILGRRGHWEESQRKKKVFVFFIFFALILSIFVICWDQKAKQRQQRETRGGQRQNKENPRRRLWVDREEKQCEWTFNLFFAIIVSKADREPDQSVQWGHGFDRGWLWGWQAQVGWKEIKTNRCKNCNKWICQTLWRGKERDGDVQAGWRWWVHSCQCLVSSSLSSF